MGDPQDATKEQHAASPQEIPVHRAKVSEEAVMTEDFHISLTPSSPSSQQGIAEVRLLGPVII
jgi:hypothetical protein